MRHDRCADNIGGKSCRFDQGVITGSAAAEAVGSGDGDAVADIGRGKIARLGQQDGAIIGRDQTGQGAADEGRCGRTVVHLVLSDFTDHGQRRRRDIGRCDGAAIDAVVAGIGAGGSDAADGHRLAGADVGIGKAGRCIGEADVVAQDYADAV